MLDGTVTFLWSVRHRHSVTEPCQEVLTLSRDGTRIRPLFRGGAGRAVPDGFPPSGRVALGDAGLNLHEPGVVRAFVDEAARAGCWSGPPTWTAGSCTGRWQPPGPPGADRARQDQRPVRARSTAVAAVPAVEVRRTLRPSR